MKESFTAKTAGSISEAFGPLGPGVLQFMAAAEDADALAPVLIENAEVVGKLVTEAPALMTYVVRHPSILHPDRAGRIEGLSVDTLPSVVVQEYIAARNEVLIDWVASGEGDPSAVLGRLAESLLQHVHRRLQLSLSVLALGSLACGDLAPNSNFNILLVAESDDLQRNELETHALLGFFEGLRHYGFDSELSIQRIHGRLFVPKGGLSGLAVSSLSPEEFVALSLTRPLIGQPERAVEPTPMTPQRLKTLVAHKKRLETELIPVRYRRRNVKFGEGSLGDIAWLLMLNEARYPTATDRLSPGPFAPVSTPLWRTEDRLRKLAEAQLVTVMERDELLAAHRHMMEVRVRLYLLDLHPDVIPENPDKLQRLAETMGFAEGNEFLRFHEEHLDAVRAIYLDSLERLRA